MLARYLWQPADHGPRSNIFWYVQLGVADNATEPLYVVPRKLVVHNSPRPGHVIAVAERNAEDLDQEEVTDHRIVRLKGKAGYGDDAMLARYAVIAAELALAVAGTAHAGAWDAVSPFELNYAFDDAGILNSGRDVHSHV